jgi:hypothetical protein
MKKGCADTHIFNNIEDKVTRLHVKAVNGTLKYNNLEYTLTFDRARGVYIVTIDGDVFNDYTDLNTRKITEAKKWLKEHLNS